MRSPLPLLTLLLLPSCTATRAGDGQWAVRTRFDRESVQGSGAQLVERRDLGEELAGIDSVELRLPGVLVARTDGPAQLAVASDENLLGLVSTYVLGSRLIVESEHLLEFKRGLRVELQAPGLTAAHVEGAGSVAVVDLHGGAFALSVTGDGSASATGALDTLDARVEGAGAITLAELVAHEVTATVRGEGRIDVGPAEVLHAFVNGRGRVTYVGTPPLQQSVRGGGSVSRARTPQ